MTRTEFLDYIKRTFLRTDKDTELIDALNDTLYDLSTSYNFQVSETETALTLANNTYKYAYPSTYALLVSNLKYIDSGGFGWTLNKLNKTDFDNKYPDIAETSFGRSDPVDYTIFGDYIYIAPFLTTITTEKLYIAGSTVATELSSSSSSPVYQNRFRECIKFGVLYRIYSDLQEDEQAVKYKGLYDIAIAKMIGIDKQKGSDIQTVSMNVI